MTPTRTAVDPSTVTGLTRRRRPASARLGVRAVPGTGFLGVGIGVICGVQVLCSFVRFLFTVPGLPMPALAIGAWVLLLGALAAALITVEVIGEQMPDAQFVMILAALSGALALDLAATWTLGNVVLHLTASLTIGAALLALATLRGTIELLAAVGVFAMLLIASAALTTTDSAALPAEVTAIAVALLPAIVVVVTVWRFRRVMQVRLDLATAESTLDAPRLAVGMLASGELADLDRAAEQLLQDVASGREPLPLGDEAARRAAGLATELRLHLVEGRRETWLAHAVTESALLGRVVSVDDEQSLAALLAPGQRDGLLSAIWQLAATPRHPPEAVLVSLGPSEPSLELERGTFIPVSIEVVGLARSRIAPGVWEALGQVGFVQDSGDRTASHLSVGVHVDRVPES